eukprot:scaffold59538_cov32-Prasinocladus_malaysianus.AAC.2
MAQLNQQKGEAARRPQSKTTVRRNRGPQGRAYRAWNPEMFLTSQLTMMPLENEEPAENPKFNARLFLSNFATTSLQMVDATHRWQVPPNAIG